MSAIIDVKLSGLTEITSGLENLIPDLPLAYSRALVIVDNNILASANDLVPVRTGYLKSTIQIEEVSDTHFKLRATAPYAMYVEFGTKKMSARLFLTHAVEQHMDEFAPEIVNQVMQLISEYLAP